MITQTSVAYGTLKLWEHRVILTYGQEQIFSLYYHNKDREVTLLLKVNKLVTSCLNETYSINAKKTFVYLRVYSIHET